MRTIDEIIDRKFQGIDCSEEDAIEIKEFVKQSISFSECIGNENCVDDVNSRLNDLRELFPIIFQEAIDEYESDF
jgi:hypothetical protein